MDTKPTPRSSKSWPEISARAAAEVPPEIDVRLAVRRRIESELARTQSPPATTNVLDALTSVFSGFRGVAATCAAIAAFALLGWQTFPIVRDLSIALQIQNDLLADL